MFFPSDIFILYLPTKFMFDDFLATKYIYSCISYEILRLTLNKTSRIINYSSEK